MDSKSEDKKVFDKNIIASTHINFLFGAGVNGSALPQLSAFAKTKKKIEDSGADIFDGIENGIDKIEDAEIRNEIKNTFINEFVEYHNATINDSDFFYKSSIIHLEDMLKKVYMIVHESQNRNPSMKQINVYTLNYDTIVENILSKLGYLYNTISASNNSATAGLLNVIGYNYSIKKYVPTFMLSKLHGDIDKPIIPGKAKYREILNEDYFEVVFNMKEQLCRSNSILIVIGYSGKDNHINKILNDCLNAGLTIYWYKYSKDDEIPFADVVIREQDDYDSKKDSTLVCYEDMERIWAEKSER